MKRIAVWGYGIYGRKMVRLLREYWAQHYEISLIFDKNFVSLNKCEENEDTIKDPEELETFYRQGFFESVMILIVDNEAYFEVEGWLEARGIPVETTGKEEDFVFSFQIPGAERRSLGEMPGNYHYSILQNIYAIQPCMVGTPIFLFDGKRNALNDTWYTELLENYHGKLDFPVPFDLIPTDPFFMRGQFCVVGKIWSFNYWHFTYDMLDQVYILEKSGFQGKYIVPRHSFIEELMGLLGVEKERIVWQEDLPQGKPLCFETIVFITQEKYNRDRKSLLLCDMAKSILKKLNQSKQKEKYPSRIFVRRIGIRKLLNADNLLEKYGFTEIVPEELSVSEQIQYFYNADIVLCPHGANSTNSLYMRHGSVFIETFGKNWVNPCCIPTLFHEGVHYLPVIQWPIFKMDKRNGAADYSIKAPLLEMAIQNAICITEGEKRD